MGHLERKLREKENLRNSMLDAAIQIAREEGWQALTIRKIADKIEYTPPIVYEYFENKEALMKELVLVGFRILHKDYDKILEKEHDPRKILRLMSEVFWNFAFKHTELYQLMFRIDKPTPNEEIQSMMISVRGLFLTLAGNDLNLAHSLMFNWMCLQNGTIATILNIGPEKFREKGTEPVDMFMTFIDRFLKSF